MVMMDLLNSSLKGYCSIQDNIKLLWYKERFHNHIEREKTNKVEGKGRKNQKKNRKRKRQRRLYLEEKPKKQERNKRKQIPASKQDFIQTLLLRFCFVCFPFAFLSLLYYLFPFFPYYFF